MPPVMGTGKSYQHEMLHLLGMHYWWSSFEVWGPLVFFAVNVLSEAHVGSISLDSPGKTNLIHHWYMGGKGGFTFLLVQTFLVNTIPEVFLDENSQRKDVNAQSKTTSIQQNTIMQSIINLNENLEAYIESGTARIRFKDEEIGRASCRERV